jgi:DNA polymerase-3 subunit epsilon
LVDPQAKFDSFNVSIHGIDELAAAGAPTFRTLAAKLHEEFHGRVVVSHTHFDRVALTRALFAQGFPTEPKWLDSARVTRRAWPQFVESGYGLHNVCEFIGYQFRHHKSIGRR